MPQLTKLAPIHEQAIRMKLMGSSHDEVCTELGIKKRTLYLWMADPIVKAKMTELVDRIEEEFTRQMASLGMAATSALLDMVKEDHQGVLTPGQRLDVIREILNRIPAFQKVGVGEGDGGGNNANIFHFGSSVQINNPELQNMTDEQLAQHAKHLADELARGSQPPQPQPPALGSGS